MYINQNNDLRMAKWAAGAQRISNERGSGNASWRREHLRRVLKDWHDYDKGERDGLLTQGTIWAKQGGWKVWGVSGGEEIIQFDWEKTFLRLKSNRRSDETIRQWEERNNKDKSQD